MPILSWNDLVYAVALRSRELGELKMNELRETASYNCDTPNEARRMNAHKGRGELIEWILVEEFIKEEDKYFENISEIGE